MSFYKDSENPGAPDFIQDLKDCTIVPEVDIKKMKYILHIKPPGAKEYKVLFADVSVNIAGAFTLISTGEVLISYFLWVLGISVGTDATLVSPDAKISSVLAPNNG